MLRGLRCGKVLTTLVSSRLFDDDHLLQCSLQWIELLSVTFVFLDIGLFSGVLVPPQKKVEVCRVREREPSTSDVQSLWSYY